MRRPLLNIYRLGVKELWSLLRDPAMLVLIVYVFTAAVYTAAKALPETLNTAPIAIVDEDRSQLSQRIINAFYPPHFLPPQIITTQQMDAGMDAGRYTFVLNIPPRFQQDVLSGRGAEVQLKPYGKRISCNDIAGFAGRGLEDSIQRPNECDELFGGMVGGKIIFRITEPLFYFLLLRVKVFKYTVCCFFNDSIVAQKKPYGSV